MIIMIAPDIGNSAVAGTSALTDYLSLITQQSVKPFSVCEKIDLWQLLKAMILLLLTLKSKSHFAAHTANASRYFVGTAGEPSF